MVIYLLGGSLEGSGVYQAIVLINWLLKLLIKFKWIIFKENF